MSIERGWCKKGGRGVHIERLYGVGNQGRYTTVSIVFQGGVIIVISYPILSYLSCTCMVSQSGIKYVAG